MRARNRYVRYGVVANIIASHAIARGSIPRVGNVCFWPLFLLRVETRPNVLFQYSSHVAVKQPVLGPSNLAAAVRTSRALLQPLFSRYTGPGRNCWSFSAFALPSRSAGAYDFEVV